MICNKVGSYAESDIFMVKDFSNNNVSIFESLSAGFVLLNKQKWLVKKYSRETDQNLWFNVCSESELTQVLVF